MARRTYQPTSEKNIEGNERRAFVVIGFCAAARARRRSAKIDGDLDTSIAEGHPHPSPSVPGESHELSPERFGAAARYVKLAAGSFPGSQRQEPSA